MAFTPATFRRATIAVAGTAVALGALPSPPQPRPHLFRAPRSARRKRTAPKTQAQRCARAPTRRAGIAGPSLLNQKGERYVSGASGPNRFDCSGFTMYVYKEGHRQTCRTSPALQMRKASAWVASTSSPAISCSSAPAVRSTFRCTSARQDDPRHPTAVRGTHRQHQHGLLQSALRRRRSHHSGLTRSASVGPRAAAT